MRQLRHLLVSTAAGLMLLFGTSYAAADVLFYTSATQPSLVDEHAVTLVNGQTGTTVTGTMTNPVAVVNFTTPAGLDVLKNIATNGTPSVRAVDGSINNVTISIPGFVFTDLILDVYGVYSVHPEVTITANANDGTVTQTFTLTSGATSRNWITILAENGETISSVTFSNAKFYALENVNVSGPVSTSTVPEPQTLGLLFTGIVGIGSRMRRFKAAGKQAGDLL